MTGPDPVSTCCSAPVTKHKCTAPHWVCEACTMPCATVHREHIEQSGAEPASAAQAGISWPPWLPRDGSGGVPHLKPGTSEECPYLGLIICGKCGWSDTDPERVQAARRVLDAARTVLTPEVQAAQKARWKAAIAARNAQKRRSRVKRPGPQITGFTVRLPRKDGDQR